MPRIFTDLLLASGTRNSRDWKCCGSASTALHGTRSTGCLHRGYKVLIADKLNLTYVVWNVNLALFETSALRLALVSEGDEKLVLNGKCL